jgi:uncharacterized protein
VYSFCKKRVLLHSPTKPASADFSFVNKKSFFLCLKRYTRNMKIALLSDSHDDSEKLDSAIAQAENLGCEMLIHAGDLIDPSYMEHLKNFSGQVIFVCGNNDREKEGLEKKAEGTNIKMACEYYDGKVGGIKLYATHYPEKAKSIFFSGQHDIVIFGHTHRQSVEVKEGKILINPGEVCGHRSGFASWAIFDSKSKKFGFHKIA